MLKIYGYCDRTRLKALVTTSGDEEVCVRLEKQRALRRFGTGTRVGIGIIYRRLTVTY